VNFYKRFIGDIQAKTGGLTLAEFGAYDRLLDHYYSTEQPINPDEIYRISRAIKASEKAAVDKVLLKFFFLGPDGYTQSKAEEQIAKALPLIEAARANGKKGGRPPKPKTPQEPSGFPKQNPDGTQNEPSAKASQSQSQIPTSLRSVGEGADALVALGVPEQTLADYIEVRRVKRAGKLTMTAVNGIEREAKRAGIPVAEAVQACCEFSWIGFNAQWYADRQSTRKQPESFAEQGARLATERVNAFAPAVAIQPTREVSNVAAIAGR
jgi:uncharacterized protein YdaU (DUF1376 family)